MLRPLRRLIDPALSSAWGRLARLWRPMAAWSLLVWILVALALPPLSSVLLGWSWLRGSAEVVANEALLGWALTPPGLTWLVLAGSLALVGSVLHFAGIFRIVTDDLEGRRASIPETTLGLAPEVPALARLCAATVLAAIVLALPLAAGLWGIHEIFLGARDINYYLAERPAAWWYAVASAAAWSSAWAAGAGWLVSRSLIALPAYLDGHRPLTAALRRSWRDTRGEGVRTVRVIAVAVAVWILARAAVDAGVLVGGRTVLRWTASVSDSLPSMVAATGGWAVLSLALDAAVAFLGIAFLSTLLTKLYYEDTDLHHAVEAPGVWELSGRLRDRWVEWIRPTRSLPVLVLALLVSSGVGALLLERMPDPRPVAVTAHRAGPPPAPENTLAALEESIEAGARWAEIDVQLTRDGVPVVVHDADLMRMAGDPRRISATDYGELATVVQRPDDGTPPSERRVATLAEFLERAGDRIGLMVELKYYGWDPRLAEEVVRVLREARTGPVMIMSLELRAVRQLRELDVSVPVGYAAAASVGDPSRLPVDFLALSRSAVGPAQLRSAHRRGVEVHVWTLNRAPAMAEVIQEGADGVITDRPALALQVRRELADLPGVARLLLRFGHLLTEEEEGWSEESSPAAL